MYAAWFDDFCFQSYDSITGYWSYNNNNHLTASFPGKPGLSRYQKGKTDLDFTGARDSEWQWHQLGRMQVCTSLQTDNHASTPPLCFFTGRMPFLPPNQQRQSTGLINVTLISKAFHCYF